MSQTSTPLVSVIILNYNGKDVLGECLDSVFATRYYPFEVIVVDNGSTDNSEKIVQKKPGVRLLKSRENVGYCAGNNAGIRVARGEYLVLLNYDTIVASDWLTELVNSALAFKADFCQPKILMFHSPKMINSTGIEVHLAGFGMLRGGGELDLGQYDLPEEIHGVHGTCIFVSRAAIDKVGLLDSNFFAYGEDTDWSWRAMLKGLRMIYVPTAIIYHMWGHGWGRLSSKKFYYVERNRNIMVLTNYSARSLILLLPVLVLSEIFTLGYCLFQRLLRAKIIAYAQVLQMRNYVLERRRRIQSERIVPDRVIVQKMTYKFNHPILAKSVSPANVFFKFFFRKVERFI